MAILIDANTGEQICPRCKGSGEQQCDECEGSGITTCWTCDGEGRVGIHTNARKP